MALDVDAIWDAISARLEGLDGVTTVSRKRKLEWGLEEYPVLMVLDDTGTETVIDQNDPTPTWRLTGELVLLARMENESESPAWMVNPIVKAIREALERKPSDPIGNGLSYYTDLGGLVQSVALTRIEKGDGPATGQAGARIEVEIVTNPA